MFKPIFQPCYKLRVSHFINISICNQNPFCNTVNFDIVNITALEVSNDSRIFHIRHIGNLS